MKRIPKTHLIAVLSAFLIFSACSNNNQPWEKHGRLTVSADGHFLAFEDSTPFFWSGETSWAIHQNLSREDIIMYLDDTKTNGFNVIQVMTVNIWALNDMKNFYGDKPYIENDVTRINPPYWELLGWTIDQAAERGLYVLLVYGTPGRADNHGPVTKTPAEAYKYGNAVGAFFPGKPNLIWCNGIDVNPDDTSRVGPMGIDGWHAMAEGITDGVTGVDTFDGEADWSATLMTYHTRGSFSSSMFFHDAKWLDFNATQLGLPGEHNLIGKINSDFHRTPAKPVVNIEPWYESKTRKTSPVDDYEMRAQGYQSIFAGACGYTYGNQIIFYFDSPGEAKIWREALDTPGRTQMIYLKKLFKIFDISKCKPSDSFVKSPQIKTTIFSYIPTLLSKTGEFALVYLPANIKISVDLTLLSPKNLKYTWYNTQNGEFTESVEIQAKSIHDFEPPSGFISKDCVLCISGNDFKIF